MNSANLIDLLDRPIAFHRVFVDITGSVTSALLLSQALYWSKRTTDPQKWFYKTQEQWKKEVGLSRREQETARKKLTKSGVIQIERRGIPATLHFRVDLEKLGSLVAGLRQTGLAESAKLGWHRQPNKVGSIGPTINYEDREYTQNTAETTTPPNPQTGSVATVDWLCQEWNMIPGLVQIINPNGSVKKLLAQRVREHPEKSWWKEFLHLVSQSKLLCGESTDWAANIYWALERKHFEKILSGIYSTSPKNKRIEKAW